MVAPAPLMVWWQMAGRLVLVIMLAEQAAPETQVDPELRPMWLEAAVALEDKGRQELE